LEAEFYCVSCKTPFLNRHPLDDEGRCPLCRLGLAGFDAVYSYGSYEGTLRTLIHLFKYEKMHTLARPLGEMLARAVPREERSNRRFVTLGHQFQQPLIGRFPSARPKAFN